MEKSPLAVHITDTHLSENTLEVNFSVFEQAFYICEQLDIKTVIHGGDIFTSRKGQPEIVLNAWKQILDIAAEKQIKIIAIAGNHDKVSYPSSSSVLDAFDGHPAFSVVSPYGSLIFGDGNTVIHFLPYYDEALTYKTVLEDMVENVDPEFTNILITHVAVAGVKNNGGGDVVNSIMQDLFKSFKLVLVGHYHNRQILGNIVYTGSAYQANFGEDNKKGCTIIYDDASYEFIDFEFPEYVTLDIKAEELTKDLVATTEELTETKIRYKISGELKESQKSLVVDLQRVAKVEVSKEEYKPSDILHSESVEIQDIMRELREWGISREIPELTYGETLLSENL